MHAWHTRTKEDTLSQLNTTPHGLAEDEVAERQKQYGPNQLEETPRRPPWRMLLDQFTETMVLILIAAAGLSFFLGETTEAIAILAIVLLFGTLGFVQEYRAEKSMSALQKMVVPIVWVRRHGSTRELPASELVPGDIVEFEAGNVVPADLRIARSYNLKIQEAALTGESEPVDKTADPVDREDLPLGDRVNMAYMGTMVTNGRGVGITVAIGMQTELGTIANLLDTVESQKAPLQAKMARLGKTLSLIGMIAAAVIFGVGMLLGESWNDMFLTAVSVVVAVVPEGLPAVVTITLALGAQRMLKRQALIRKLPAVETLGSVTVICSDKTGTLTQNKMTVTVVDLPDHPVTFDPDPEVDEATAHLLDMSLAVGVLCTDASLEKGTEGTRNEQTIGDPTEVALLVAGAKRGLYKDELYDLLPRVDEVPFDSTRKRMSTAHQVKGPLPEYLRFLDDTPYLLCTKGSADGLVQISDSVWQHGKRMPLDAAWKARIMEANKQLADQGIRVLGLAFRTLDADREVNAEEGLTFIGVVGMIDPPRPEVAKAVARCQQAGIRPVMITGDHPLTAAAIARELKFAEQPKTVSGEQLQKTGEGELLAIAQTTSVYARVSPEDKLNIVAALRQNKQIVAMTGDGVNDAPALKKADIGVAMGITGTDVAQEAADMVLLDDNFTTIVAAVEEGRVIFDNLRRFVRFSLAGNIGKVLVMLVGPFLGMTIALQPLQLLWLNLLTDGLLGLGLGTEPAEKNTMQRPPRDPEKGVLVKQDTFSLGVVGVVIATVSLGLAVLYFPPAEPTNLTWQTIIFATIGFGQLFQALALRSSAHSPFALTTNPLMTVVVTGTLLLQLGVMYLPFMNSVFGLVALPLRELLISVAAGSVVFLTVKLIQKFTK